MYFFAGLVRSSFLYGFAISVIKGAPSKDLAILYATFLAIHTLICKLSKDHRDATDILFGAIGHDIIAPFLGIKSLLEILLQKYLTDRHEPDAAVFMSQGIIESVWGVLLVAYLTITLHQVL